MFHVKHRPGDGWHRSGDNGVIMPDRRSVEFTDYAQMRMHQRDIDASEVLQALAAPGSRHRHRNDGRSEARTRIPNKGMLLVVYRKEEHRSVVINAMWE
jgi:hypothetical protein